MDNKKKGKKKASAKKEAPTPRRSVISLSLNGSLDEVLKALVPKPNTPPLNK